MPNKFFVLDLTDDNNFDEFKNEKDAIKGAIKIASDAEKYDHEHNVVLVKVIGKVKHRVPVLSPEKNLIYVRENNDKTSWR